MIEGDIRIKKYDVRIRVFDETGDDVYCNTIEFEGVFKEVQLNSSVMVDVFMTGIPTDTLYEYIKTVLKDNKTPKGEYTVYYYGKQAGIAIITI